MPSLQAQTKARQVKPDMSEMQGERIAKVLARVGVASRRESEKLIEAGRIKVNGKVLTTLSRRKNRPVSGAITNRAD